jgi:hypothetical protein
MNGQHARVLEDLVAALTEMENLFDIFEANPIVGGFFGSDQ